MGKTLSLPEVSSLTGIVRSTLYRWAGNGKLQSRIIKKGSRDIVVVEEEHLLNAVNTKSNVDYSKLHKQWLEEQKSGYHTGKPLTRSVDSNLYGMEKFWEYLDKKPSVREILLKSLRIALSNVPVDYNTKNCHFTQRDQMYKAVRIFYKLLMREELGDNQTYHEMGQLKPKRVFPPKKTVLQKDKLTRLLEFNDEWLHARTEYDRILMRSLIILIAY